MNSLILWVLFVATGIVAWRFYRRQALGHHGGPIAKSKVIWLALVVYSWFVVPFVFAHNSRLPWELRIYFLSFGVWMWLRGTIELFLMYKLHKWKTEYGIVHNTLSIVGMAVWFVVLRIDHWGDLERLSQISIVFIGFLLGSLFLENYYVYAFQRALNKSSKTTEGKSAVYFACGNNPHFARVLTTTSVANCVVFSTLLFVMISYTLS